MLRFWPLKRFGIPSVKKKYFRFEIFSNKVLENTTVGYDVTDPYWIGDEILETTGEEDMTALLTANCADEHYGVTVTCETSNQRNFHVHNCTLAHPILMQPAAVHCGI